MPHLHILHPLEERHGGMLAMIGEVEQLLRAEANWNGCRLRRSAYDLQAGFDVPTQADLVVRCPGPVLLLGKVRAETRERFARTVARHHISVYNVQVSCAEDIWLACEEARLGYERGEPLIPLRELIAYLIVRKLHRMEKYAGEALNKNFLWAHDLPKGGFPKDIVDDRAVLDVAEALVREDILKQKRSEGKMKYGLGSVAVVAKILESRSFESCPRMQKFFSHSNRLVSARNLAFDGG